MTQNDRATLLKEIGYKEPFDDSPINNPEGWFDGSVSNTGGNNMCRIWRTWEQGDKARDTEFEVIYNVSQDSSVAIQKYVWEEKYNSYSHHELVDSRKAEENSDKAQALIAKELMKEHNSRTE